VNVPRWRILVATAAVAAAAAAGIGLTTTGSQTSRTARLGAFACTTTVTPSMGPSAIASTIVSAAGGSTICLASGSYPFMEVLGATHNSYVTIRPVPGARATVAGMEVRDSSFLRFQGLHMTEGFNMRDGVTYPGSHDYQFIEDVFEEPLYGIVLAGGAGPIKKVLIEKNYMHHVHLEHGEAGGKCDAGYAEGQDVTLYSAEGVTITRNTFRQAEWHYIQGGSKGPEGVTVEHNLFEGHIFLACSHLNVWQIVSGGIDDTFANNIVRGESGKGASVIALIFENGAGGEECATKMTDSTISNNLFIDAAKGYNVMLTTTKGLTYSHNTVIGGEWGQWLERSTFCGAGEGLIAERNIGVDTESTGSPQRFILGECRGICRFEHNVSDDTTADQLGSRYHLLDWRPSWRTTSWNLVSEPAPPAGYYLPTDVPFAAGYEGDAGP
jgi:hypothetical protein